jgi:hypothetical protein
MPCTFCEAISGSGKMGNGILSQIHSFLISPLNSSPRDLFLIVGLLIIIVFLWTRILNAIEEMI